MAASAIYEIRHIDSGRAYIGSAVNLKKRWRFHRWQLSRGIHHNAPLQRAWTKYGEAAFLFSVMEVVPDRDNLIEVEQTYLDRQGPTSYNICKTAGSSLGRKFSDATRQLMSKQRKGRKASNDARAALSESRRGRPKSAEHRRKIGESQKGRACPQATRDAVSRANKARVHSSESRRKNSEAQRRRQEKKRGPLLAAIAARFPDSIPTAEILMIEFGMGNSTARRWRKQWADMVYAWGAEQGVRWDAPEGMAA